MEPFVKLSGVVAPIDRVNIDTDQVIPAVYLKRIERIGYGQFLFSSWRFLSDGSPNPDFVLNRPGYAGASVLVAGRNFGSGSSREHAPWALLDYGFRCVIAPSFADIFYSNCFQNGILPVTLPEEAVARLIANAQEHPGYDVAVDLDARRIRDSTGGVDESFQIDPFRRHSLMNGLDEIGLTLQHADAIAVYESRRHPAALPHT